jgi:hypothetical protein
MVTYNVVNDCIVYDMVTTIVWMIYDMYDCKTMTAMIKLTIMIIVRMRRMNDSLERIAR